MEALKAAAVSFIMYICFCAAADQKPDEYYDSIGLPSVVRLILFLPNSLFGARAFRIVIIPLQAANILALLCYTALLLFFPDGMAAFKYVFMILLAISIITGIAWHMVHKKTDLRRMPSSRKEKHR